MMFGLKRAEWLFVLALAAVLALTLPAAGHETDQFTMPAGRQFADLGPYLNRWMYGIIERGVDRTNARISQAIQAHRSESEIQALQSPDEIVRAVNHEIPWAMDVIDGFDRLVNSPEMKQQYPGLVVGYKEPFVNILQHTHFILDPRQFFRLYLASTIKAYGVYMGTDKLGHFTDMGMNYYRDYRKALSEGKDEQEAMAQAVYLGTHGLILSERGMLGYLTAGAYSNGDLSADYLGLLFYRNLTEPMMLKGKLRPPLLYREGPYWKIAPHVRPDSDFFALFISNHLNEALNPSLFETGMRNAVRKAVKERSQAVLSFYRDPYGNPLPKQYFEECLKELSTYYGQNYGHEGTPDELISIANTCFPPDAQAADPLPRPVYLAVSGAAAVNAPDSLGRTALHWAAGDPDAHVLQTLLEKGADPNARDWRKQIPLHRAAQLGSPDDVERLLLHGASPAARDDFGATPLHLAAARRDGGPIVRLLLAKGADVNARDDFGCTPLHDAARAGSEETIRFLLQAHAQANVADAYGATPLHLACRQARPTAAQMLLQAGANANAANVAGATPLHEAASVGEYPVVKVLLSAGARTDARNSQGQTPAKVAKARGHEPIADLLRNPDQRRVAQSQ